MVSARAGAADGDVAGPLRVLALPGHADDHLVFVAGRAAFTGDAVLGEGSVFVSGRLREYLDGLRRLRALDLARPLPRPRRPIWDVRAKLDEYLAHRLERERKLLAALEQGLSGEDELLDAAWADAPPDAAPVRRDLAARAPREAARGGPPQAVIGETASATRRRAISSAAASGVAPVASAWSSIVRSVSPTARTRASARSVS